MEPVNTPQNLIVVEMILDDSIHALEWAVTQNQQADSEEMTPKC
jgi:hypothetical protein